jgi:hypothetical protein
MEMGYFVNVSEENAASIRMVNPEDVGSMAQQNATNTFYFSMVSQPKVNKTIIFRIKNTMLLKYKCKSRAVPAQLEGPQKIPNFLNVELRLLKGWGAEKLG